MSFILKKGKYVRTFLCDIRIILGSVWRNLVLFAGMLLTASAVLMSSGCYGDASWGEVMAKALYMARMEGAMDGCRYPDLAAVFVYIMPVLTVLILGEGVLRLTSLYLGRRLRSSEWEELMVSNMKGHMIICGAGELGRALIQQLMIKNNRPGIVVVDTREGILHELGIHDDDVHHIYGDMTSQQTLELANVQNCSTVILASGDDSHNLETATKVHKLNPKAEIWVRLYRTALSDMMDTTSKPNFHFFSPYEKAAAGLIEQITQEEC